MSESESSSRVFSTHRAPGAASGRSSRQLATHAVFDYAIQVVVDSTSVARATEPADRRARDEDAEPRSRSLRGPDRRTPRRRTHHDAVPPGCVQSFSGRGIRSADDRTRRSGSVIYRLATFAANAATSCAQPQSMVIPAPPCPYLCTTGTGSRSSSRSIRTSDRPVRSPARLSITWASTSPGAMSVHRFRIAVVSAGLARCSSCLPPACRRGCSPTTVGTRRPDHFGVVRRERTRSGRDWSPERSALTPGRPCRHQRLHRRPCQPRSR